MATLTRLTRLYDDKIRDYVMVRGQRQTDETAASKVYFLVTLEYNSSPAFPNWGSKLHLIDKVTEDVDVVIEQEVERCLQPLIESRTIKDLKTTVTVTSRPGFDDYIKVDINFRDAAGTPDRVSFAVEN